MARPAKYAKPLQNTESDKTRRKPRLTGGESQAIASLFSKYDPLGSGHPSASAPEAKTSGRKDTQATDGVFAEIGAIFDSVMTDMKDREEKQARADEHRRQRRLGLLEDSSEDRFQAAESKARSERDASRQHDGGPFDLPDNDEELSELVDRGQMTPANAIELVTKRETAKIEAELREAVVNLEEMEFWGLCQERIFSLVKFLDSPGTTLSSEDEREPQDAEHSPSQSTPKHLEVPSCIPLDAVIAGVYPRLCRTAFILLNLHFPESPLIAQFRTTINSLGRESAFLGLSTLLFNDMLYYHWRVTHNFAEVVTLCRDMQTTGARPNKGTIVILDGLLHEWRNDMQKRRKGKGSLEPWWDLPPNRRALRELLGKNDDGLVSMMTRMRKERRFE